MVVLSIHKTNKTYVYIYIYIYIYWYDLKASVETHAKKTLTSFSWMFPTCFWSFFFPTCFSPLVLEACFVKLFFPHLFFNIKKCNKMFQLDVLTCFCLMWVAPLDLFSDVLPYFCVFVMPADYFWTGSSAPRPSYVFHIACSGCACSFCPLFDTWRWHAGLQGCTPPYRSWHVAVALGLLGVVVRGSRACHAAVAVWVDAHQRRCSAI